MTELRTFAEIELEFTRKLNDLKSHFIQEDSAFIEQRFFSYCLLDQTKWNFIKIGIAQHHTENGLALLHEGLLKFVSCYYLSRRPFSAEGLGAGGYDFSHLIDVMVFAAALGRFDWIKRVYHSNLGLAKAGYPAHKQATNLLMALLHHDPKQSEKAIALAEKYILGKSYAKFDIAYVSYFLSLLKHDSAKSLTNLETILQLYHKTDWFNRNQETKPVFFYGLIKLAEHLTPSLVSARWREKCLDLAWQNTWLEFERALPENNNKNVTFTGDLSFLPVISS
jgi:hypothetical protein